MEKTELTPKEEKYAKKWCVQAQKYFAQNKWAYGLGKDAIIPDAEELYKTVKELFSHVEKKTPYWASSGRIILVWTAGEKYGDNEERFELYLDIER